ncbi:hypothetical protein R3P38DRAFT_2766352 [Favolaschia claudopus]|uniref:DUF7729 domain-containing protein n=1 Tax=Favolaschia claudopus TaxID=2862362 RepID=A0AAW0D1C7_9AGAR
MFTPPPSPGRPPADLKNGLVLPKDGAVANIPNSGSATHPMSPETLKRRIGRRTKWTVILVPVVLILIAASTRYLTHPAAFDMFSDSASLNWETFAEQASDWTPHKRHAPAPPLLEVSTAGSQTVSSASLTGAAASTSPPASSQLPISAQTVPTIPASPPALPTPFPQPFDSDLSQNFSSVSCFNFFANMTNTPAFRSCRPFSLLLQASEGFLSAQEDLERLNTIVWGTCSTTLEEDECSGNIAWFSSNLASSCAIDLKDGNAMALNTQIALNAFGVMRNAGCLVDPSTNTYCYLDAVRNSNPSDTYFYSLPLGISMPNNTIASCSACTKSLMTLYYGALKDDSSTPTKLSALQRTYSSAAKIAVADCGNAYATLIASPNDSLPQRAVPTLLLSAVLIFTVSLLSLP